MAAVDTSPKSANEPREPASPRPSPALPSVPADAKTRSSASGSGRLSNAASSARTPVPATNAAT